MKLTHQQQRILEALACFKYLTVQQMVDIGISTSTKSLSNRSLYRLKHHRKHFVDSESFGVIAKKGRLADVYCLTKNGAALLAEALRLEPQDITYPIGGIQFHRDYFHRLAMVDFHIAFRRWAEINEKDIEFFYNDFEKIGSQRKGKVRSTAKTRVYLQRTVYTEKRDKAVIADCITRYQDGEKSRLAVVEIHNGTHSQRITEQLLEHLEALQQGLFSEKFGHDKANFVLSVHENQSTLDSVRKRLMQCAEFQPFLQGFHFNLQSQVKEDFSTGWTTADGEKSNLIYHRKRVNIEDTPLLDRY